MAENTKDALALALVRKGWLRRAGTHRDGSPRWELTREGRQGTTRLVEREVYRKGRP